jgi:mannose-6-phosphate isomerase-like protein (cupin superfamily)
MRIISWINDPNFPISDKSCFRCCWEYNLLTGESTVPRREAGGEELILTLEGTGELRIEGEEVRELRVGELIVLPAGSSHYVYNPGEEKLRGLVLELTQPIWTPTEAAVDEDNALVPIDFSSAQDMDEIIAQIPGQLDESEAIHLIIRLFDLAGSISEQIEGAMGLDSERGYQAIRSLEQKVMRAVVVISDNYQCGDAPVRKRF